MSNMSNNNVVSDGTASFAVRDKRLNTLLDILYPIGSIKITVTDTAPFAEYGFGTWEEVSKGRVLWGADDSHAAGSTIEAGLPNITGEVGPMDDWSGNKITNAFYKGSGYAYDATSQQSGGGWILGFDASRCSSVYGKSTTVTPPLIRGSFLAKSRLRHIRRNRYASIISLVIKFLDSERRRDVWKR